MKKFSIDEIVEFLWDAMIFESLRWWSYFQSEHIRFALENGLTLHEAFYVIWEEDNIKQGLIYRFYKIEDAFNKYEALEKFIHEKWLIREDLMDSEEFDDLLNYTNFVRLENIKSQPQKDKSGYIYLIESTWVYKIGKTKNISSRIKKYITENPNKITLIHAYHTKNCTKEEIRLHEKFQEKRVRWEWFHLSDTDINYIKQL